jgi:hypothetical protein
MKNPHPEIEVLFISPNQQDAENCFEYLKKSGQLEKHYTIIPKYYIAGKGEAKLDARENMIVVFHADSEDDFNKIKPDITHFHNCKYRCLFSNKEEAKQWMKEFHDHGIKILIGMQEHSLNEFNDLIIFFLKAHGGWKEGHIPEHKEHHKKPAETQHPQHHEECQHSQHHETKGESQHSQQQGSGQQKTDPLDQGKKEESKGTTI